MDGITITRHTGSGEYQVHAPWIGGAILADTPGEAAWRAGEAIERHRQAHRNGHASCGAFCALWLPIDEDDES